MSIEKLITNLQEPNITLAMVGGKGVNLAKLFNSGFNVPNAFILNTNAYRLYVQENNLQDIILSAVKDINLADLNELEKASHIIREAFSSGKMPDILQSLILENYTELGKIQVAVRSSATAEDLPDMSFAGQQDTFLNVVENTLFAAVVNCWSSLWTARAIGYRMRNGISANDVALAVIVQNMIASAASGVLFTANPMNGKRFETVIDATLGLGEALVSGQVVPDHYVIDTDKNLITTKKLGAKATVIRCKEFGGTEIINSVNDTVSALSDETILELAHQGKEIVKLYDNMPQDIEWAFYNDKIYILQTRAITSLFPVPEEFLGQQLQVFVSFAAVQGMFDPITPLGQDAMRGILAGGARVFGFEQTIETQKALISAGERLWGYYTPVLYNSLGRKTALTFLSFIDQGMKNAVEKVINDGRIPLKRKFPTFKYLWRIFRFLFFIITRVFYSWFFPKKSCRSMQNNIDHLYDEFKAHVAVCSNLSEHLRVSETILYSVFSKGLICVLPRIIAGMLSFGIINKIANGDFTKKRRVLELMRGLPYNVTTEMDLHLWQAAQSIKNNSYSRELFLKHNKEELADLYLNLGLPYIAQDAMADFMTHYGMRGIAEIDIGRKRWNENPSQVIQMLQNYLTIEDLNAAPDKVFANSVAKANEALEYLMTSANSKRKAKLIKWFAKRVRQFAGLRETPKFLLIRSFGLIRQGILQHGAEFVSQGKVADVLDLFFLRFHELYSLAAGEEYDWQSIITERKKIYEKEMLRKQIPRLLLSDGEAFYEGVTVGETERNILLGSPVSPGIAEGLVRIVHDPSNAELKQGEILVCHGTDPAWTPLFMLASGLVMEVGGLMTHGSVVAREYGIPAVVGVNDVTQKLKTGQKIKIDGTLGKVIVLDL